MTSTSADVRELEFVWLWLHDEDGDGIAQAVDIGIRLNAMIETVFPPIVTFWLGALPGIPATSGSSAALVKEIRERFGKSGKAVYGKTKARVGNIGSKTRFHYGVVALSQAELLLKLSQLPFGLYEDCSFATH